MRPRFKITVFILLFFIFIFSCGNSASAQGWYSVYELINDSTAVEKFFTSKESCDQHYAKRDSLRAVSKQNAIADAAMASYAAQAAWSDLTADLQKISKRLDIAQASYNGLRTSLELSSLKFERPDISVEMPDDSQLVAENQLLLKFTVEFNRLLEGLLQRGSQLRNALNVPHS